MAHTAAFSFCFASPASEPLLDHDDDSNTDVIELRDVECRVSPMFSDQTKLSNLTRNSTTPQCVSISGPLDAVKTARGVVLARKPKIKLTFKIPVRDDPIITSPVFRQKIAQIEANSHARIKLMAPQQPPPQLTFVSEHVMTIEIFGKPEDAYTARVRVLVLLDEMASQLIPEVVQIPIKLHSPICGRKRGYLQPVMEETSTNIYFPSAFEGTGKNADEDAPIYITGSSSDVSRAKDILLKLAQNTEKSLYHKDSTFHPRKLDWLQLHCHDGLSRIMRDNGSFIVFPKLGSDENLITVYAKNRVNAERTLRSLNILACSVYEAYIYFDATDNSSGSTLFNSLDKVASLVRQLTQISEAEVVYRSDTPGCLEVTGSEKAVGNVTQRLLELDFAKIHQNTIYRVELSNEQREFISGKKSGKINKIMKTSGAKIKFQQLGEYNFVIEVESHSFADASKGLALLQEELPAEISFYVPEMYHKRIIGVGGKNIQRIMKKYGVYVKFSNAEEFAALGGYYDNDDNVVARTPMKNKTNLENLRVSVMELLGPKDKDLVTVTIDIPFRMHRSLRRDQVNVMLEIDKTGTRVLWPDCELASDTVGLVGPEAHIETAKELLGKCVQEVYEFHVPTSAKLDTILASDQFREAVVQRLQDEFDMRVDLSSSNSPPTPPQTNVGPAGDQVIPVKVNMTGRSALPNALSILVAYLREHHVPLYGDTSTADKLFSGSAPSRADSFSQFGSKVLAASPPSAFSPYSHPFSHSPQPPQPSSTPGFMGYSLFNYTSGGVAGGGLDAPWKPLRDMNSPRTAENIRAIFDAPNSPESLIPSSSTGIVSAANGTKDIWANPQLNAGFLPPTTMTTSLGDMASGGINTFTTTNGFFQLQQDHESLMCSANRSFRNPLDFSEDLLEQYRQFCK